MKGKYFPRDSELEVSILAYSSFVWKSIIWFINKGTRWIIGNGKGLVVYMDHWVPHGFRP